MTNMKEGSAFNVQHTAANSMRHMTSVRKLSRLAKRKKRVPPKVLPELGIFGTCNCGGTVRFYDDCGVRCDKCKELHGVRAFRKSGGGFK